MPPTHAAAVAVAALLLTAAARAEEPPSPPPADGATTAASPAPEDDPWGPYADAGWDDAPTFVFGYRPYLERHDPTGFAAELRVTGRVGGKLQLDGGLLGGSPVDDGWKGAVRRAQVWLRGDITFHRVTEYKFGFAIEETDFFLNDFYLRWRFSQYVDSVRVGYFDPPIGLDALAGSSDRALMEVGSPSAAFTPGYRLGLEVAGTADAPSITWLVSLSSVGQSQKVGDASDAPLRAAARLAWRPWHEASAAPDDALLHVGGSLSFSLGGGGGLQYRSRPESFLADYVVDTGELRGTAGLIATELAFRRGPVLVQSEVFTNLVEEDDAGDLVLWGAYVGSAWAVTGESRPYDPASALFGRIVPDHPFAPFRGGWGAVELAGRLSWLDLSEGDVRGGRMLSLNLGPTWTLNRFVRLQAGYVWAHVVDVADGARRGNAHVLQSRLDLQF